MRTLGLVILAACSSTPRPAPAPPAPKPAAPVEVPGPAAWIGVRVDPDTLRVTQIVAGAPGDRGGVKIGDLLVSVAGQRVTSAPGFVERVRRTRTGETIEVAVERDGAPRTLQVTVEARPMSVARSMLIGKPAPAFAASSLSGPFPAKLADLRGQVVVIDFWATWCGPCAMTIPRLSELHAQYASRGLRIVGLSNEEPDVINAFVTSQGIPYTVAHDAGDEIAASYLREGIPMFVVIDRAGIVRHVIVGADVDGISAAVAELLP